MRQPLDVGGQSEVLGGPQEAWEGDRVCVCPPGPDTPGTTLCSRDAVTRVDGRPALAVVTPGDGARGGSVHHVRLPSGSGQLVMLWIKGCHLSRLVGGASPCSPRDCQESSPAPQFKRINSLVLSCLYSPAVTSTLDYWRNHSFE